jgi:hypothetical protein
MVPENIQNRTYTQIKFIGLQNNRHPAQHPVGTVHKASGNCQQRNPKEAFADSFQKVYERCQQCVVKDDDYFEGQ